MPSSSVWGALGAFLQHAGAAAPKIAQDYNDEYERRKDREELATDRKRKRTREDKLDARDDRTYAAKASGGKKIQGAMAAILNPMDEDAAREHLAKTPPAEIKKAEKVIEQAGSAVGVPKTLPKQAQRWERNKVRNALARSVEEQESGSADIKEHPRAANGLQAYGRFGIVPELHIDKVGLNPKNPDDIAKWKADKALQKETFERIIDANMKKANGDPRRAAELYYGDAADKNKKQRLADGREMDSVNEYTEKVLSRMGYSGGGAGVEKTAGNARQAIDELISEDFKAPSKAGYKRQEKEIAKLYASMDPEEIEANKEYLDRITALAASGKEEYKTELTEYGNNLNRQTTAAINAMRLDEEMQRAMIKSKSGVKDLTPGEVRALESRRKTLENLRKTLTDFTTRVGAAKPGAREAILSTRPDMTSIEEPTPWARGLGYLPFVDAPEGKRVIDDAKIQKKLDYIDENLMETERALAGLGGLGLSSAEEIAEDEETMLSGRSRGRGGIDPKYLTPVKK